MNRNERIEKFVSEIRSWYARHKRSLPWRDLAIKDDTKRAYRILVSEIMLQQTQVSRVIVIYKRFLRQFPRLADLAGASNKDVIMAWRGMGYNSRALRLRDAARVIAQTKMFPRTVDHLLAIPGIGPYTAAAIRNFAFNLPTPCIDTNIRRILHRTFIGPENADGTWKMNDERLLKLADVVLRHAMQYLTPADWHAALMDFGSLVQTKNKPRWDVCPLTAAGVMVTTPKRWKKLEMVARNKQRANEQRREPGRFVGFRFIPNRIFRGKIVDVLRDTDRGLSLETIGKEICIDWEDCHKKWLKSLIKKLVQDGFVTERRTVYQLSK